MLVYQRVNSTSNGTSRESWGPGALGPWTHDEMIAVKKLVVCCQGKHNDFMNELWRKLAISKETGLSTNKKRSGTIDAHSKYSSSENWLETARSLPRFLLQPATWSQEKSSSLQALVFLSLFRINHQSHQSIFMHQKSMFLLQTPRSQ